jgi:hypothetical protein
MKSGIESGMVVVREDPAAGWVTLPQGQRAQFLLTAETAPWTRMSVAVLNLVPGQFGVPHDHGDLTPVIRMEETSGMGVATLLGDNYEDLVWIRGGEWGSIGFRKHLAIYPRLDDGMRPARGVEICNVAKPGMDVRPDPDSWPTIVRRVAELGWMDKVTWPQESWPAVSAYRQMVMGDDTHYAWPGLALDSTFHREPPQ